MTEARSMFSLPVAEIARRLASIHNSCPVSMIGQRLWIDRVGILSDFDTDWDSGGICEGSERTYSMMIVGHAVEAVDLLLAIAAAEQEHWRKQADPGEENITMRPDFEPEIGYECPGCGVVPEGAAEHVRKGHPEGGTPDKPPGWEPDWERVSSVEEIRRRQRAKQHTNGEGSK